MALYEDITYSSRGRILEDSLMQYKIPSRLDVGRLRVEFESSYEESGPFGAKSIGEVVINTPLAGYRPRHLQRHRRVAQGAAHHAGEDPHGSDGKGQRLGNHRKKNTDKVHTEHRKTAPGAWKPGAVFSVLKDSVV